MVRLAARAESSTGGHQRLSLPVPRGFLCSRMSYSAFKPARRSRIRTVSATAVINSSLRQRRKWSLCLATYPRHSRILSRSPSSVHSGWVKTKSIFPEFQIPTGYTLDTYLEKVTREGFNGRRHRLQKREQEGKLRRPLEEYQVRLEQELKMIQQMKFSGYFLIVWTSSATPGTRYPSRARPGFGCGKPGLLRPPDHRSGPSPVRSAFERFLNPARITPPDIDIDFCMLRRNEVIDYVTRKYGRDNVSQIITFGTMAARAAIATSVAAEYPYAEVDRLARLVPQTLDTTLEKQPRKSATFNGWHK